MSESREKLPLPGASFDESPGSIALLITREPGLGLDQVE